MEIGKLTVSPPSTNDWIDVFLMGDFHEGNCNFEEKALERAVAHIKKNAEENPYTFVILMGDYCEYIVSSSDPRWDPVAIDSKYKIRDLKNLAIKQNEYLFSKLEPIKDIVVAMLIGNHGESFIKHNATDVYDDLAKRFPLAKKLGYVGYFGFKVENKGRRRTQFIFALNHGEGGGGKTIGYPENKLYDLFAMEDQADYCIAAHMHKLIARSLKLRNPTKNLNQIKYRRRWLGCSGSFLSTYKVGNKNYFEHKGREPSDIGMLKASFRCKLVGSKEDHRDLRNYVKQTLLKKIRIEDIDNISDCI